MCFANFDFMFPCFFVLAVWCLQHSYLHLEYHHKKMNLIITKHYWWKSNYPKKHVLRLRDVFGKKKLCWGKLLHFHFGSADNLRGWPIMGRVTFSGSLAEKTSRSLTLVLCPPERSQSQWDGIKTPVKMTMMVNHPYNKAWFFLQQKFGIGKGCFNH